MRLLQEGQAERGSTDGALMDATIASPMHATDAAPMDATNAAQMDATNAAAMDATNAAAMDATNAAPLPHAPTTEASLDAPVSATPPADPVCAMMLWLADMHRHVQQLGCLWNVVPVRALPCMASSTARRRRCPPRQLTGHIIRHLSPRKIRVCCAGAA
jgi:hypothetical protein